MNRETYEQYEIQSDLQQQASESSILPYSSQMQEQVSQAQAILVSQTNPIRVLEEIELKLKGQIRNPDGSTVQITPPLMNNRGISRMLFLMSTVINQNTILSHLEDKEISKLIIHLGDDVVDDLTLNWKDYDIKGKIDLDYIIDAVLFPTFFALKRALGQNEKNWLGKITVENISGGQRLKVPKKESWWSKFKI